MENKDTVLGIDIGGTTTAFGFLDRRGKVLAETSIPTQGHQPAHTLASRLHAAIEAMRAGLPGAWRLRGIGVCAPNANQRRGTIEHPVNLDWGPVTDFPALLRPHYDLPIVLSNDANAAAIGEMLFGGAQNMKDFIVITLGTGLGSGIIADGQVLCGSDGFAGELGHTVVEPEGRQCRCGKRGCLEAYVSAPGLCRTVCALLAERSDPGPWAAVPLGEMTAKRIFLAATEGDPIARAAFDATARILGMKLADAVAHTSPEAIFLFGGLAAAGDLLLRPTEAYMNEYLFHPYRGRVKLLPSQLQEGTSAILGAAALIWNNLDN